MGNNSRWLKVTRATDGRVEVIRIDAIERAWVHHEGKNETVVAFASGNVVSYSEPLDQLLRQSKQEK